MSSAAYRFVRIQAEVVAPPVALADLDLSVPLAGGSLSGEVEVSWEATTQVCVGESRNADRNVTPIQIGNHHYLPGPSLKGMVRSILEIATYSHLGRINYWRQHGIRTYEPEPMPVAFTRRELNRHGNEVVRFGPLRAGWLRLNNGGEWALRPAWFGGQDDIGFRLIQFGDLGACIGGAALPANWSMKSGEAKYGYVLTFDPFADHEMFPFEAVDPVTGYAVRLVRSPTPAQRTANQTLTGHFVFTSAGVNRRYEAFLAPPHPRIQHTLRRDVMTLFHRLHSDPGRKFEDCDPRVNPSGPWRYWLCRMGYLERLSIRKVRRRTDPPVNATGQGIPVFYVGTPGQPDFFLGLSRVLRLPWARSVGEVAQNVYEAAAGAVPTTAKAYRVPRLPRPRTTSDPCPAPDPDAKDGWDFARALFGWVEDAEFDGQRADKNDKTARALAGRVSFEFAKADGNPQPTHREEGVLGTPRESFYPFYLERKEPDPAAPNVNGATYDDAFAVPAGRKRYVVRETIRRLDRAPINPATNQRNTDLESIIHFLPAGTRFKGAIRFHNLHPVELGALLWALTFGEPSAAMRRQRHQIGRAKPFGFGALLAHVSFEKLSSSDSQSLASLCGARDLRQLSTYIDLFRAYMSNSLGLQPGQSLEEQPPVADLLKFADPRTGRDNADRLEPMPLEGPANVETYQATKAGFDNVRVTNPRSDGNCLSPLR